MTGAIIFVAPDTTTQIWVEAALSLLFLIALAHYVPFTKPKLTLLHFTSQLCTLFTLLGAICIRTGTKRHAHVVLTMCVFRLWNPAKRSSQRVYQCESACAFAFHARLHWHALAYAWAND